MVQLWHNKAKGCGAYGAQMDIAVALRCNAAVCFAGLHDGGERRETFEHTDYWQQPFY